LPLIAFYPVERSVIDIPLKIREKHQFLQIDGYDNALNNAVDFRRFFEWFRDREDVENELTKRAKKRFN
jgi:predicted ATP-binding protein involved in virulence